MLVESTRLSKTRCQPQAGETENGERMREKKANTRKTAGIFEERGRYFRTWICEALANACRPTSQYDHGKHREKV